jgi:hypothetical protein
MADPEADAGAADLVADLDRVVSVGAVVVEADPVACLDPRPQGGSTPLRSVLRL